MLHLHDRNTTVTYKVYMYKTNDLTITGLRENCGKSHFNKWMRHLQKEMKHLQKDETLARPRDETLTKSQEIRHLQMDETLKRG